MSDNAVPETRKKPALCDECPAYEQLCVMRGSFDPAARITFVLESPQSVWAQQNALLAGSNGTLLKKLVEALRKRAGVPFPYSVVHAAGAEGKPSAEIIAKCSVLWKQQWSTHHGQQTGPHVIVPFGLLAAKSVGLAGSKIMDIRGRMQQRSIGNRSIYVVPTLSLGALYVKPGLTNVVLEDITRAVHTAYLEKHTPPKSIEELSANYVFPKSLQEVEALCNHIINYYDPEKVPSPWAWPIAVDIETNTLKPFRRDARVLMISFAWEDGKAAAILLNHPANNYYDPAAAWPFVRRVLECPKPKAFHNCLTGDTLVTLPGNKRVKLEKLVKQKYAGKVLTVNEATGALEEKQVINWVNGPVRKWDEWRRVEVRGKGVLRLTEDHEVITVRGRVAARDLQVGDLVYRGSPSLNPAQKALVYGSLAGDASLILQRGSASRAPHVVVSHCKAQEKYARLKAQVLGAFHKNTREYTQTRGFSAATGSEMLTIRSRSDIEFAGVMSKTHRDGKKVMTPEWWAEMNAPALAIWYCDDGTLSGQTRASICVSAIGGEIAAEGLRRMGFPASLWTRPDGHTYLDVKGPLGRGMSPGLRSFWETIAPFVPTSMAYKLPDRFRHLASDAFWTADYLTEAAVDAVTYVGPLLRQPGTTKRNGGYSRKKRRGLRQYCLTVEGNQNFIASGLAVSNCKFDLQFIERVGGVKVHNVCWDTMCAQHWISEDQKGVYGLKALAPSYAPQYEGYEEKLHEALRMGEEVAPTEADVIQEAKELSATTGEETIAESDWLDGAVAAVESADDNEAEPPPNNDRWLAEPAWPEGAPESIKAEYRAARDSWFAHDQAGRGKDRGTALRTWKRLAKKLDLPVPKPVTQKEIAKALSEWEAVSIDTIMPYAAADADVTRLIYKMQWRYLRSKGLEDEASRVMNELYLPGARALGALEFRGAKVNIDLADQYDRELTEVMNAQETIIHNLALRHFRINASKQLAEVLVAMGFPSQGTTSSGQMKTGKDVLLTYQKMMVEALANPGQSAAEKAANQCRLDFIEALLLYRAATKMKQSFLRRIKEYSALDGHIHTTFHLTGTATGRLSSSRLNLQNLPAYMCRVARPNPADPENPIVIHQGFNVKALLVPESDDEVFWNLDIKAAEIRVAAYYSGDQALIDALNQGLDVHTFFLTKIRHPALEGDALSAKYKEYKKLVDEDDADTTKFRGAVKRVVFGTLYGAGPKKIAAQIGNGFPLEEAQAIIAGLFQAFPGLKAYISQTKDEIARTNRTKTVFGRYRRFALAGVSGELRSKAEREGVNFRIQSTSSDLVLSQLCEINDHLHEIEATMRLTVHDSIAGTIKRHRVKDMQAFFDHWLVNRVKERFPWMPVPFLYDLEVGSSYGEKMKYKDWLKAEAAGSEKAA